nr:membrane protein [Rhizobium sp. Q54]
MDEELWKTVRVRKRATYRSGKTGALNIALLFGTAAIALSLIITPMLAETDDAGRLAHVQEEFDRITTGSIAPAEKGAKHYTIRRSVLQETPGSVCIIQPYDIDKRC